MLLFQRPFWLQDGSSTVPSLQRSSVQIQVSFMLLTLVSNKYPKPYCLSFSFIFIVIVVVVVVVVCFCVDIRLILVMPMTLWIFVLVNLSTNVFCCLLFDYTMRSTRICALSEQVHAQRAWATGKACKCMLSAHRQLAKLACCANPKNVSIL